MGNVVNLLLVLAILGCVALMFLLLYSRITSFESAITRAADGAQQAIKQASLAQNDAIQAKETAQIAKITAQNAKAKQSNDIAHWNQQIAELEKKMNGFAESIKRMEEIDTIARQARAQASEIANRYVLYREPKKDNSGVEWSKEYKTGEDNE